MRPPLPTNSEYCQQIQSYDTRQFLRRRITALPFALYSSVYSPASLPATIFGYEIFHFTENIASSRQYSPRRSWFRPRQLATSTLLGILIAQHFTANLNDNSFVLGIPLLYHLLVSYIMDQTDQRPAKRSIFEQGGPKQKKMSKFDQKLFSRSPPTPIPRIPISNSAPVSPIEEGASSDVREPPSSQRADDDTPESISQESPPDALGISGLDSQKLTSANMDVEGSNRATGADADAGKMRKMEVLRGSPPPLVTILPDIYPIEEDLETCKRFPLIVDHRDFILTRLCSKYCQIH